MMKLAGIFRDLEQLYEIMILKQLAMAAINIPCKFDEDIFINE